MDERIGSAITGRLKNTALGFLRIRKNLCINHLSDSQIEAHLKAIVISTSPENIEIRGKNYYFRCYKYNAILTIHSKSYTVITAKQIDKQRFQLS